MIDGSSSSSSSSSSNIKKSKSNFSRHFPTTHQRRHFRPLLFLPFSSTLFLCLLFLSPLTFFSSTAKNLAGAKNDLWTKEDVIKPRVGGTDHTDGAGDEDDVGEPLTESEFLLASETSMDMSMEDLKDLDIDPKDGYPEGASGKFEGDIKMNKNELNKFVKNSNSKVKNGIRNQWRRWPRGEIPYVLSSRYGTYSRRMLARAMKEYHEKTCVKFVPRDSSKHRDYIYIFPDDGCYSLVGRTGGRQPLSLDSGCIQFGTILHELMHTVGFFHEQSRNDRDEYIDIRWEYVMRDARDQFEKYSLRTITHLGADYDYGSIMHYGQYAFTRNGRATIVPRFQTNKRLGQRSGFSETDLKKINDLYKCSNVKKTVSSRSSTPAPPSISVRCRDKRSRCSLWESLGHCRRYKEVRQVCPLTCGICERPATTTTEAPRTRRPSGTSTGGRKRCADKNPTRCAEWEELGMCSQGEIGRFMRKFCPTACQVPGCTGSGTSLSRGARSLRRRENQLCRVRPTDLLAFTFSNALLIMRKDVQVVLQDSISTDTCYQIEIRGRCRNSYYHNRCAKTCRRCK